MITTADWLRYIDSLGPTDPESMRSRLQSAGADVHRAEWLVSIASRRQVAHHVARVAMLVLTAGLGWDAYQWWLALSGSANAPGMTQALIIAAVVGVGALTLMIASAMELSPPLDLNAHPAIPKNLPPSPRRVTKSGRSGAWRIFIAALCMMLSVASLAVVRTRNRVWLRQAGVETTGRITSLFTTHGSKGSIHYHMRYQFDRGEGRSSIGRRSFDRSRLGQELRVTYLPSQPEINEPMTRSQLDAPGALFDPALFTPLVFLLFIGPLVAAIARAGLAQQRLLGVRGVAVVGEITRSKRQWIEYRFEGQGGRFSFGKRHLREPLGEGQPIVILYDPQKPKRSVPLAGLGDYEFS